MSDRWARVAVPLIALLAVAFFLFQRQEYDGEWDEPADDFETEDTDDVPEGAGKSLWSDATSFLGHDTGDLAVNTFWNICVAIPPGEAENPAAVVFRTLDPRIPKKGRIALKEKLLLDAPTPELREEMDSWPKFLHKGATFLPVCGWASHLDPARALLAGSMGLAISRMNQGFMAFQRVDLSWCPDPNRLKRDSEFISFLYSSAFSSWPKHGLLADAELSRISSNKPGVHCYDELWVGSRDTLLDPADEKTLRDAAAGKYPDLLSILAVGMDHEESLQIRCMEKKLRIAVVDRGISNMDAVDAALAQRTSAERIQLPASLSGSLPDIIKSFNSFDVLITRPGSHLAGLFLTAGKNDVGILQLGEPSELWQASLESLEFKYVASPGHGEGKEVDANVDVLDQDLDALLGELCKK